MPFLTYAQNFEDLILSRALRGVEGGLYIDLGAADPDAHTVTRAFYERGWRGINVEPHPWFFDRLTERRPGDVNVKAAVSDVSGEAQFFFVGELTGLNTLDPEMARLRASEGNAVRAETVRLVTLAEICEQHVGNRPIHFLKLDVEGHELAALKGHDFSRWRPWIILSEAHDEQRTWDAWKGWDVLLEQNDYRYVYQDGVNRFYVIAEKHDELARFFVSPPNCYDNWMVAEASWHRDRMNVAEQRVAELEAAEQRNAAERNDEQRSRAETVHKLSQLAAERDSAKRELAEVRASNSWKITAPLRRLRARSAQNLPRAAEDAATPEANAQDLVERVVANAELMAALHFRHGTMPNYENVLRAGYERLIKPGETVIDVGAHVGDHTAVFCKLVGPEGMVVAFEPLPDVFQELQANITSPNARLLNACLSDQAGRVSFVHARGMPSESGMRQRIYNHPDIADPVTIEVTAMRLDDWLDKINSLSFIKIDVEGGEMLVLDGAQQVLAKFRPIISVEYGFQGYSVYGYEKRSLWNFAEAHGYILGDLFGAPCPNAETWDLVCGRSYWDYYMIPKEKVQKWRSAIEGI